MFFPVSPSFRDLEGLNSLMKWLTGWGRAEHGLADCVRDFLRCMVETVEMCVGPDRKALQSLESHVALAFKMRCLRREQVAGFCLGGTQGEARKQSAVSVQHRRHAGSRHECPPFLCLVPHRPPLDQLQSDSSTDFSQQSQQAVADESRTRLWRSGCKTLDHSAI